MQPRVVPNVTFARLHAPETKIHRGPKHCRPFGVANARTKNSGNENDKDSRLKHQTPIHPSIPSIQTPAKQRPLCSAMVFLGWKSGFRPDFGRILIGKTSRSVLRPAFRRPGSQIECSPDDNPAETRPGSPICAGPETKVPAREHYCITKWWIWGAAALQRWIWGARTPQDKARGLRGGSPPHRPP